MSFGSESSSNTKLINFLLKNNTGEKWLVAVPDCSTAESIILATGKPVMALGGFSGNDKILTVASLSKLVKEGQIKYYMVGGSKGGGSESSDDVTTWVKAHGKVVSSSLWSDTATSNSAASSSSTSSSKSSSSSSSSGGFGGFKEESSQVLYDLSSYK
jgi:4-amino-4-deoxy-L-arabinose transferase-like glycosyltransferase